MSATKPALVPINGYKKDEEESRIVRPELNIEKWGAIFSPSQARVKTNDAQNNDKNNRKFRSRVLTRVTKLSNGSISTDEVIIDECKYGLLNAKDQRVLYALLQVWSEQNYTLTECYFSIHRLLQILRIRNNGGNDIQSIKESLHRLNKVTITFKQCFYNVEKQEIENDEISIHILADLHIKSRTKLNNGKYEKSKTTTEGYFQFHPRILKNLIKNYTRPVLLDVVITLKSDIAQLIYGLVDRQIVGKVVYHITTESLFKELGLEGKKYKNVSGRKQALEKPLTELVGKPLSSGGVISSAELITTKSGNDYKVVFAKKIKSQRIQPAKIEKVKYATYQLVDLQRREEPQPPQVNESHDWMISELRAIGITDAKAHELVERYSYECEKQLESFPYRDLSKVKSKAAWMITAITQGYAIADAVEEKEREATQRRNKEAEKQARATCPYCKDSSMPGMRWIVTEKYPNGAYKDCTHNQLIENQFQTIKTW